MSPMPGQMQSQGQPRLPNQLFYHNQRGMRIPRQPPPTNQPMYSSPPGGPMLRQEIVSYLLPFPSITSNLAFRLATLIFAKTRFCSHIRFIGQCLKSNVIPKGFQTTFLASKFSNSSGSYLADIQKACTGFSKNIMRSTIRAMSTKRNQLDRDISACRSELERNCPAVLVQSIRSKIRELNSKIHPASSKPNLTNLFS